MIFGSICSGIGAPEVAWQGLGWRCAFQSEIDPFPRAVLAHRFGAGTANGPKLFGDFTQIGEADVDEPIDLLVGGTPCQSFSVAGKRLGLDDPRGNLAIEFLRLARRLRPRWLVWENVPGVRSSGDGRDLGAFLGLLGECGYGWAYRSLDAQFAGLAQRRERVFVVAYLGDWRRAAAVLFEPEGLRGDSAPSREAGERVASTIEASLGRRCGQPNDHDPAGGLIAGTLGSGSGGRKPGLDVDGATQNMLIARCDTAREGQRLDYETETLIAHSLRADGYDASEDGTGRGTPLVPVAFDLRGRDGGAMPEGPHDTASIRAANGGSSRRYIAFTAKDHGADAGEIAPTLRAGGHANSHANASVMPAVAFTNRGIETEGLAETVRAGCHGALPMVGQGYAVRRLTPRECERLQGFPDDWTQVPYRGKPAKDGPRYKAIGNGMAVPVVRWIGERIAMMEAATP